MDTQWGMTGPQGQPGDRTDSLRQRTGDYVPPQMDGTDYGPDYPFEEPPQAPELRGRRSQSLYSRSEPFWDRVYEVPRSAEEVPRDPNYWNHPESLDTSRMLELHRPWWRRFHPGAGSIRNLLIIFGVLVVVGVILYSTFLQVRTITVTGNANISEAEIVALSGLKPGMSSFSVDEEAVTQRIERNRYLRCTLVDVKWDSVVLHVMEREPIVYINHNGMLITLDNRGWVLEEKLSHDEQDQGLIYVTGMAVRRCSMGQAIVLDNPAQLNFYTQLLVELKAMRALDTIAELDMSSMDSIYLATRDGFDVRLGDRDQVHEKLRAMMITRDAVKDMGYEEGTIDVTDPARPTYRPVDEL